MQLHHGESNMNCIKVTNLETQSPIKVNKNKKILVTTMKQLQRLCFGVLSTRENDDLRQLVVWVYGWHEGG